MTCVDTPRAMPRHWVTTQTEIVVELTLEDLVKHIRDYVKTDLKSCRLENAQMRSPQTAWLTLEEGPQGMFPVITQITHRFALSVEQILEMVDGTMADPRLDSVTIRSVNGVRRAVRFTIQDITDRRDGGQS